MTRKKPNNDLFSIQKMKIQVAVDYALQPPLEKGDARPALILCLHGYGQTSIKFIRLFRSLHFRNIIAVAPQAPNAFYIKMRPKTIGFTWLTKYERDRAVQDFVGYMELLLSDLYQKQEFDTNRIFLLGFSQGVSMALRFAVSSFIRPAGVIACGGDLPEDVEQKLQGLKNKFPIFICHGREDTIVPLEVARKAERKYAESGHSTTEFYFPGGHEIPPELVARIADWVEEMQ